MTNERIPTYVVRPQVPRKGDRFLTTEPETGIVTESRRSSAAGPIHTADNDHFREPRWVIVDEIRASS